MRFLYSISIWLYAFAAKIRALNNRKAYLWVSGRTESFAKLRAVFNGHSQPVIWFHAASLGEFEQGRPIIENFRKCHPDWKILLTFFSPSGYEIRKDYGSADCVIYLPIDSPGNARKFVKLVQPKIAVFIKYEFWYNYLYALKNKGIQTFFVSTIFRPSQYFFKWYGAWFQKQLRSVDYFFVQNQKSGTLLHSNGFTNVAVAGDTRFDRVSEILQTKSSYPLIEAFKGKQKLCIAGSSWLNDEMLLSRVFSAFPNFKFLIVPHEIDELHLEHLERLISQPSVRYSQTTSEHAADVQVMIVDQIGHLSQLYQYADIAYIGGGFDGGIHNILEAAVFGIPILFGPNYRKFQEAHDLIALEAAKSISTPEDLSTCLHAVEYQTSSYLMACQQSANYVERKKGATPLILEHIEKTIALKTKSTTHKSVHVLCIGLILLCTWCISTRSFAQETLESDTVNMAADSIGEDQGIVKKEGGSANAGRVFYFYETPLNASLPELRFIDTTKSLFHRYDPLMANNYFRVNRGNVGLPTENLEYLYTDNILFSYGKSPFELYRYKYSNTKFYQNVNPYVELFYVMGKEKEQNFRVLYAQNIFRGLNVGAEFNVINSPGVYMRTFSRHNNIRLFSNFISKNKHYRAVAGYYFNKIDVNENGGVTIPYDSMSTAPTNPKFLSIRRQEAENSWREHSFYVKQSYYLGINRNDSIPNSGLNFGYLSHALEVTRYATSYRDKQLDMANYSAIYRDSAQTFDSTYVGLIRNTLSWNIGDVTSYKIPQFFNLSVGATVDLANISTGSFDSVRAYRAYTKDYNYVYPFAKMRLNYRNRYFLTAGMTMISTFEDISTNAELYYVFNKDQSSDGAFVELNFSKVRPRPFHEFYVGNNFQWDTSFNHTQTLHVAIGARWKGFHLRGEMATFHNYIYLSSDYCKQADAPFSVFKASLEKTFKYKFLALDTRLVFQLRPTEIWMQLPKFSTRSALYFDFVLLQTTPIQVGVEMYYNTAYASRYYNPTFGSFYGQGDLETGGFAYMDAFLNLRVQRRANLFLKWANFGTRWFGDHYVMTDGYPTVERAFQFGVLWRFYD